MKEFMVRYWVEFLYTSALGILGYCITKIRSVLAKEMADQSCIKLGVQAILRDRIIQSYNLHSERGYCAIHDRDNISNLYEQYHNLGANGVIDGLVAEMLALPVHKIEQRKGEEY